MALIKCPECQREISDTLETCIHCGYKLTPKESKTQVNQSSNQSEPSLYQVVCRSKSSSGLTKFLSCNPLFLILNITFALFSCIFLCAIIFNLANGFNQALTLEQRNSAISFGNVVCILFFCNTFIPTIKFYIKPYFLAKQFLFYCKANKINYVNLAKKELSINVDTLSAQEKAQMATNMWYVKQAMKYENAPKEQTKDFVIMLICSFTQLISTIIFLAFLMKNIENLTNYVYIRSLFYNKSDFNFNWCTNLELLIITVLLDLIIAIISSIIQSSSNKFANELLRQDLKEEFINFSRLPKSVNL